MGARRAGALQHVRRGDYCLACLREIGLTTGERPRTIVSCMADRIGEISVMSVRTRKSSAGPEPATWLACSLPVFAWAALTYPGYLELHSGFRPVFNLADLARQPARFRLGADRGSALRSAAWRGHAGRTCLACCRAAERFVRLRRQAGSGASFVAGALGIYGWAWRSLRRSAGDCSPRHVYALMADWAGDRLRARCSGRNGLPCADAVDLVGRLMSPLIGRRGARRHGPGDRLGRCSGRRPGWRSGWQRSCAVYSSTEIGRGRAPRNVEEKPVMCRARPTSAETAILGWSGGVAFGIVGLLPVIARHGLSGKTYVDFADHFVYLHQLLPGGGSVRASPAHMTR